MRHYKLKPLKSEVTTLPVTPMVRCESGAIPIDRSDDISYYSNAWKDDPATNRQRKVLTFFNYTFPEWITKGTATKFVTRLLLNPWSCRLWDCYNALTNDCGSESPCLLPFSVDELLADPALAKSFPKKGAKRPDDLQIVGSGMPPIPIHIDPPEAPTGAQIEFLRFIEINDIPTTRKRANEAIADVVYNVREVVGKCFPRYSRMFQKEAERTVIRAVRTSPVWSKLESHYFQKLPMDVIASVKELVERSLDPETLKILTQNGRKRK